MSAVQVEVMVFFAYHAQSPVWTIVGNVVCGSQTTKTGLMLHAFVFLKFLVKGFYLAKSRIMVSIFFTENAKSFLHAVIGELWKLIIFTTLFIKWFISRPF